MLSRVARLPMHRANPGVGPGASCCSRNSPRAQGELPMDLLKPADIVANMVQAGVAKARLGPLDLLIRGCLSGALLGFATSLAIGATVADRPAAGGRADLSGRLRHDRAAWPGTGDRQFRAAADGVDRATATPSGHHLQLVLGLPRQPDRQRVLRRSAGHRADHGWTGGTLRRRRPHSPDRRD